MNFRRWSLALPLGLLLAGCGHDYWVQQGASDGDFHADIAHCEAAALQAFPYDEKTTQFSNVLARNRATCTRAGLVLTCTEPGRELGPPLDIPYDANAGRRAEAIAACMAGRGWQRSFASPAGLPAD
jgi:hypothetical protein